MSLGKAIVPLFGVAAAVGLVLLRGGKAQAKGAELDEHPDKGDIKPPVLPDASDATDSAGPSDDDSSGGAPDADAPAQDVPGYPTDSNPNGPPATGIPSAPPNSAPGAGYGAQVAAYYAAWKRGEKVPPYLVNGFKKQAAKEAGSLYGQKKPGKKPPVVLAPKALATSAVSTVRGYIVLHGKPPEGSLEQVKAFQKSVRLVNGSKISAMKADGIWGPLTRAAAAETLGVVEATLPLYAAKFAPKVKPAAKAPAKKPASVVVVKKPAVTPDQKKSIQNADQYTQRPVADGRGVAAPLKSDNAQRAQADKDTKALAAPSTSSARDVALKAAAKSASDAVRGYIVIHSTPPTVAVAEVRRFQTVLADSNVKADGLWGPMTRAAAAKALGVPADGNLPPYAAAFAPKGTGLAFPARTPVQAANDLYSYLTKTNTIASTWGTRAKPNETVRRAQADLGGLVADGVYGALTRARGKALNGQPFPARPS